MSAQTQLAGAAAEQRSSSAQGDIGITSGADRPIGHAETERRGRVGVKNRARGNSYTDADSVNGIAVSLFEAQGRTGRQ